MSRSVDSSSSRHLKSSKSSKSIDSNGMNSKEKVDDQNLTSDDENDEMMSQSRTQTPSKRNSDKKRVLSPEKKRKRLIDQEKELNENVDKLKKHLSRAKSKQRELENPKFPIRDELLSTVNLKGVDVIPLPPLRNDFILSTDHMTDALTIWNFVTTFKKYLSLAAMSINDFMDLIQFTNRESVALTELYSALLRAILSDHSTANHISSSIPRHLNFTYRPKSLNSTEIDKYKSMDVSIDHMEYDSTTNSLKLLPSRLHVQLVSPLRFQSVLRAIITRLEPVQRLRKAVAQLEYAQISLGKSSDRRLSRRLSLNTVQGNALSQALDNGKSQYLRDKDAVLNITANAFNQLQELREAVQFLDEKEIHELSPKHKLIILRVLCDACLETESMRSLLEKNELDRIAKIASINKQIKEAKLAAKEVSQAKRDAAIAAWKKTNNQSKSKSSKSKKSSEPTAGQLQLILDDILLLESIGVDEVVPSVTIDIPSDNESDDGDNSSPRRRSRSASKTKKTNNSEYMRKLQIIDDANEALNDALQSQSEKDIKQAIKQAVRAGLRFEERGKTKCTQLLKKVYKLQYDLDCQAKEDRLQSQLEKALLEYPVRTLPLGMDRYYREYYVFDNDYRIFVRSMVPKNDSDEMVLSNEFDSIQMKLLDQCDPSIQLLYQSRPSLKSSEWGYYSSQQVLWQLCQALDERGEREKSLKSAIISHFDLKEPEQEYLSYGSEYIGRKVRRIMKNKRCYEGLIVGWNPPEQDDDVALWHIVHDDGDEEDLELHEIQQYLIDQTLPVESNEPQLMEITYVDEEKEDKSESEGIGRNKTKQSKTNELVNDSINTSFRSETTNEEAEFDENVDLHANLGKQSSNEEKEEEEEETDDSMDEPYIIKSYSNYSYRSQLSMKLNQIGLTGLQSELLRFFTNLHDDIMSQNAVSKKELKKTWEANIREGETVQDFQSLIIRLEEMIHKYQTVDDKKEEDEILREKNEMKKHLQSEGWSFESDANEYIGRSARRFFPGYGKSDGMIVAYLPSEANEGTALWRLEHFDGDEEDLDENDLLNALRHFDGDYKEDDNVMVDDDDDGSHGSYDSATDDESSPNDSQSSSTSLTLWPSSGVRSRWIEAVNHSKTVGDLAFGLSSLMEYARAFGVVEDDPYDPTRYYQSKSMWTKNKVIASPKAHHSSSKHFVDDFKRPSREASKKVKSYAEV